MGVSATHLDWTMVPYVRRSFRKHYLTGLQFINDLSETEIKHISETINKDTPLSDPIYQESNVYRYALAQTEKELKQAVEGMYHNLKY